MKIACITTTINVPRVLELYLQYGPDVQFFVAIDDKTPREAWQFCDRHGFNVVDHTVYACDKIIGRNQIQRRNLAMLEALKWGAEIIVSIDDDNIPLDTDYFDSFERSLATTHSGLEATASNIFDVGQLLFDQHGRPAPHRGIPHDNTNNVTWNYAVEPQVGVLAGICLGDPDVSATTRIANSSTVHRVSELLHAGFTVHPETWTVFNSQNTAIKREFAPAWFMWSAVGRYDDIFASLIVQRVMKERGHSVKFGRPFVWQTRNAHNLTRDLEGEIWGMNNFSDICLKLESMKLPNTSVIDDCRHILRSLTRGSFTILQQTIDAGFAFLEDAEGVMR